MPESFYDFARRFLVAHGGTCSRQEQLDALQADPLMKGRLATSRGFAGLLSNLRHSRDIVVADQTITATNGTVRRVGLSP